MSSEKEDFLGLSLHLWNRRKRLNRGDNENASETDDVCYTG
jgi:hypothetical protein